MKLKVLILAAFGLLLVTTSCNKDEDLNTATLSVNVDDELYTAEVFDEIAEIGDEAMDLAETQESPLKSTEGFKYNRLSECVSITKIVTDSVITTTIDFGEVNCLCNDGRERRGKIIMTHEGRFWDGNVYINFAFDSFFVDDNQMVGEKLVEQTINADGNREATITISGSIVLADGTGAITMEAERTRTVVEGSATRTKLDDVIETTGGSTCTLADGTIVTSTILEPLVRKNEIGCFMYIVQGVKEIVQGDESPITIDYGNGECDNLAEVTQDGETIVVELQRKRSNKL
jgi:hypothetical protein